MFKEVIWHLFFEKISEIMPPLRIPNILFIRDRPRFFDQVGHQTTNASIGNKYFFIK